MPPLFYLPILCYSASSLVLRRIMTSKRYIARKQALHDCGISEYQLARKFITTALGHTGDPATFNGHALLSEPVHIEQLREVLQFVYPRQRPTLPTFTIPVHGDPVAQADAVIEQMASGALPPDVAQLILQTLRTRHELAELTELAVRVRALEQGHVAQTQIPDSLRNALAH